MPVCLSIQSAVAAGHVGHGASDPALALEGVECWPLATVALSGHAGARGVEGRRVPGAELEALGRGLAAAGALARVDAVLTGYLGTVEAAQAVADIVAQALAARPDALFLCDPVLGDDGPGLYLPAGVGEVYRGRLLPMARAACPNVFELGWLTGAPVGGPQEIREAAERLRGSGPDIVFVTSVPGPEDEIGVMTVTGEGAWLSTAARAERRLNGAGDFTAALLLSGLLKGMAPEAAAARAVAAASALAAEAVRLDRDDLPVVAAREVWTRL